MLRWGFRQRHVPECLGQLLRIVGAAIATVVGLVPEGNTGGTNVNSFKRMPIPSELAALIESAHLWKIIPKPVNKTQPQDGLRLCNVNSNKIINNQIFVHHISCKPIYNLILDSYMNRCNKSTICPLDFNLYRQRLIDS